MLPEKPLLIRNAEVNGIAAVDVYIRDGHIAAIQADMAVPEGAEIRDAAGGALLPGLKDHHMHLAALAVSRQSLQCGPPRIADADALAKALKQQAKTHPDQWIRGIGYHESVAGDLDAAWLDAHVHNTPLRIQHRGGRLWVLNNAALEALQVTDEDPLERRDGRLTGRLYEGDLWLRERLASVGQAAFPNLAAVSRELASYGITGITDTSPQNDVQALHAFAAAQRRGELLQSIRVMGNASLDGVTFNEADVEVGEHKFHLLESALPDIEQLVAAIKTSHRHGRSVAFHCVTRVELMFALAALHEAGSQPGDRIEHAAITTPECLVDMKALGVTVVTQAGLIAERGDHYLAEVDHEDQPWLYRLQAFIDADVPLAGSSDAPYTATNPWLGMRAAVLRQTRTGQVIGEAESLSPEQALNLYTSALQKPGVTGSKLEVGTRADLCLLTQPWSKLCVDFGLAKVALTLRGGRPIWSVNLA